MSGRRACSYSLFVALTAAVAGCQTEHGVRRSWNPFARNTVADSTTETAEKALLPKFARRSTKGEEKDETATPLLAQANVESLLTDGQAALADNRLDDARRAYESILSSVPDNATAHHGLAMTADLSQDWADAEYHYKQALRVRPRDANLLCDIGYSYVLQNRYAEAGRYLNQAIEVNPQHESAHMNLALLDLKQGNHLAARQRIEGRFGTSAAAAQAFAQLEQAAGLPISAIQQASTTTQVPPDATLEDVRQLAAREREIAEQQRLMRSTGAAVDAGPAALASSLPSPPSLAGNGLGNGPVSAQQPMLPQQPVTQQQQPVMQTPPEWNPTTAASQTGAAASLTPGPASSAWPSAQPGFPTHAPHGSPATPTAGIPSASASAPLANPGAQPAVVQVRGTGAFQNQAQPGGSYGMPVGFANSPGASSAVAAAPASYSGSPGAPAAGWPSPTGTPGVQSAMPSNSMPLDGLNVGPGALFPIRTADASGESLTAGGFNPASATGSAIENAANQHGGAGPGSLNGGAMPAWPNQAGLSPATAPPGVQLSTVSGPGTNSLVNGAMYAQPASTLPSYDWALQQQAVQQSANGQTPGVQNQLPARQLPPMTNPLDVYERERQRLDEQYHNAMKSVNQQPLGPQHSGIAPTAQY